MPRNIQATGGDWGVSLSWEAPSSWGSWQAAGFELQWRPGSSGEWNFAAQNEWDYFDPTLTSAVWRTFPPGVDRRGMGTSFQFRILAWTQDPAVFGQPTNAQNSIDGPWSEPLSATLQPSASGPPPVAGLVASWVGATSRIQITWDAPSGIISRYNVELTADANSNTQAHSGTSGWVGLGYGDGMVRPRLVFGPNYGAASQFSLNRNSDYWVRVQQQNSRVNSNWVRVKVVVVDAPPDDLSGAALVRSTTGGGQGRFTETAALRPHWRVGPNLHRAQVSCSATHVVFNLAGQQTAILPLSGAVTLFGADDLNDISDDWARQTRRIVVFRPSCAAGWPSPDGAGRVAAPPPHVPDHCPKCNHSDRVAPSDAHSTARNCPIVEHSHGGGASHMHQPSVLNNQCVYNITVIYNDNDGIAHHRH